MEVYVFAKHIANDIEDDRFFCMCSFIHICVT